jgi:hypothetical protein
MGSPHVGKLVYQCCLPPLRAMSRSKQALSQRPESLSCGVGSAFGLCWAHRSPSSQSLHLCSCQLGCAVPGLRGAAYLQKCFMHLYSFPNSCKVRRGRGRLRHNFIDKASWYSSFTCMLCVHAFDLCEIPARSCQLRRTSVHGSTAPQTPPRQVTGVSRARCPGLRRSGTVMVGAGA